MTRPADLQVGQVIALTKGGAEAFYTIESIEHSATAGGSREPLTRVTFEGDGLSTSFRADADVTVLS